MELENLQKAYPKGTEISSSSWNGYENGVCFKGIAIQFPDQSNKTGDEIHKKHGQAVWNIWKNLQEAYWDLTVGEEDGLGLGVYIENIPHARRVLKDLCKRMGWIAREMK